MTSISALLWMSTSGIQFFIKIIFKFYKIKLVSLIENKLKKYYINVYKFTTSNGSRMKAKKISK